MAITVFLGVEREKISQYMLEKLLLFFFSVSGPVSLRTKTGTGRAGEGAAAAAWSDPSLLPAEAPVPVPVGRQRHWSLPPGLHPPRDVQRAFGNQDTEALGVPGGRGWLPLGQISALGPLSPS